ncbi:hypothetical protein L6R53_20750 [Myxococcota bacterium]|nr:hypothetical protein [Myxococcota bacterium]
MLALALPLLLAPSAWAAPVVDPVASPEVSRVRVISLADLRATKVEDSGCAGSQCQAWDQRTFMGAELQVALLPGLAVAADAGRLVTRVDEADVASAGFGWGLAVRGALPLSGLWWLSAQARLDGGAPGQVGPDTEKTRQLIGTGTLELAWGDLDGGLVGHLGAQASPLYQQQLQPLGPDRLELTLRPVLPVGAVAGFSFLSEPLGAAWNRPPRLAAHVDATGGQTTGVSAGVGVAW